MSARFVCAIVLWSMVLFGPISLGLAGGAPEAEGEIAGSSWVLREIEGRAVLETVRATLTFEGTERVAGDGGCNRFFGAVEIDGSAIAFGPLGATRKACGEGIDDQEIDYLRTLARAAAFHLEGDALLLVAADQTVLLRFERAN